MRSALRFRLRLFTVVIIFFALVIATRLYFVQVVHGADFALKAEHQYTSASQALYDRGAIYFTRKDGTLLSAAGLSTGFRLAIDPERVKDADATYTALNAVVPIDAEEFHESAAKTDDPYEVIEDRISEEAGRTISGLEMPGVIVERERWRNYPADENGAQSIGFVAFDDSGTKIAGRYGLERYYEDVLSRDNSGLFGNFFAELFANVGDAVTDPRHAKEGDVVTTIEPVVEEKLEQILEETNTRYGSLETSGIVMDPKTGEIIALASYPSYNPNDFRGVDVARFNNPLVEHQYEFGSIMKPLTMAAGLDAGVITPDSVYNDTGCFTVNTAKICNYDHKARGPATPMQEILSQSLNVGASYIATRLGHDRFRSYFTGLGFGTETGIDLPGEVAGDVRNIMTSPRDVEYDTASFGQGLAETPVQMIRALGALANGGAVVSPHLTRAIRLQSGVIKELTWGSPKQVFGPEAVTETTRMLVKVVDVKLANGTVKIPDMSVAAKTGTAQIAGPGGKYRDGAYFHSFFGYFPAYDPKFVILLYTREPKGVEYASETLTHPFMELTHFLISYYSVPPDRGDTNL